MTLDPRRLRPEAKYTGPEIAALAGLDDTFTRAMFRALGLPAVPDDAVEFLDRDLEVLKILRMLLDQGYEPDDLIAVARTYGYAMSRVAVAEVRLFRKTFMDPLVERGVTPEELDRKVEDVVPALLEILDSQIQVAHRRHLARALEQVTASAHEGTTELLAAGFVDLVGFSKFSSDIEADDLGDLVSQFETLAVDRCVEAGAEVVKVIGDSVMFVAAAPATALKAAIDAVVSVDEDPDLPPARAGLDHGSVRPLGGDYIGRPVNIAARLTTFAKGGTVVVSESFLDALPEKPGVSHIGRTRLKGVGSIRAFKINW